MEGFIKFKSELQKHFEEMQENVTQLFEVDVDKDELWNTYLDSFSAGTNEIFRERREHDCSCCRHFIKNIGAAVSIKDNKIHTIWELNLGDTTYQPVCDALDKYVKAHSVIGMYTSKFKNIGTDYNYEEINGKPHKWDHFFLTLPRRFVNESNKSKVEEIPVQDFIDKVLPTAKEVEAYVENKHEKNFVSMIAPVNPNSKPMFKWGNRLSWAYTGNITDSDMKQKVKAAGGNVEGVLRFSIQWNEDGRDNCDLDAHCIEPDKNHIYFGNCRKPRPSKMTGELDVDVINPCGRVAVENITWSDLSKMKPGVYKFFVNQFSGSVRKGFRAEIEFNGELYKFDYNKSMRSGENVQVAEVTLDKDGNFSIKEELAGNSSISSHEVWGVNTNKFIPVSVISYSPNYFDGQDGIGHRHLFFFLKDCVNAEEPNGFYNEFLKQDLQKHKRVFEALGAKCHVEDTEDQLSGIGFSMTKRSDLIVKVKGATERVMKIKF